MVFLDVDKRGRTFFFLCIRRAGVAQYLCSKLTSHVVPHYHVTTLQLLCTIIWHHQGKLWTEELASGEYVRLSYESLFLFLPSLVSFYAW